MLLSFCAILNKDKSLDDLRRFCTQYVAKLDKPVKKNQVPKSLKSMKSLNNVSPDTEADEKGISIQTIGHGTVVTRGEEVRGVLKKNKGILMSMKEDEDDE